MHSEIGLFAYTLIAVVNIGIGAFGFRLIYQHFKKSTPIRENSQSVIDSVAEKSKSTATVLQEVDGDTQNQDEFYEQALLEITEKKQKKGLWARCLAEVDGEKDKATARYIKCRVAELSEIYDSQKLILKADKLSPSNKYTAPKLHDVNKNLYLYIFYGVSALVLVLTWNYYHQDTMHEQNVILEEVAPAADAPPIEAAAEASNKIAEQTIKTGPDECINLELEQPIKLSLHNRFTGKLAPIDGINYTLNIPRVMLEFQNDYIPCRIRRNEFQLDDIISNTINNLNPTIKMPNFEQRLQEAIKNDINTALGVSDANIRVGGVTFPNNMYVSPD